MVRYILRKTKKYIKRIIYDPYKNALKNGVSINKTYLTDTFQIINCCPKSLHEVRIGEKCLLSCTILFESPYGLVTIGDGTYIGDSKLISACKIEIGNNVMIAWGVTIYDHNSHNIDYRERIKDQQRQLEDITNGQGFILSKDWSVVTRKPIRIGDNVWIGFDAVIMKGVTIGEGAIVASRAVVIADVKPWTIVAGNPAVIIKEIPHE